MCLDNEIFEVQQFLTNIDVWNNENISYILSFNTSQHDFFTCTNQYGISSNKNKIIVAFDSQLSDCTFLIFN